jgi:hypothetical protein
METTAPRPDPAKLNRRVMTCGCADVGSVMEGGKWVRGCPYHGVTEPMDPQPQLAERIARCTCMGVKESSPNLAFFRYRPTLAFDSFYCGCKGWD